MLSAHAQIVIFWGPDLVALYNDAYAPGIGRKHPQAFGRPAVENWRELWPDLEPLLRHVLDTGETVSARDRRFYIERHGYPEDVYFDISYSALRDDTGEVRGVFCIVNETTARVTTQRALRESEERLHAIIAQATAGIVLAETNGRLALVNAHFCDSLGYREAELLGMRIDDIIHGDDLGAYDARFRKMIDTGDGFVAEIRYVRKDGSVLWTSTWAGPIRDGSGRVRQANMMVMGVSERRQAAAIERRLAAIIESSDDAILSTDLDMTITSWNHGAERLYGYMPHEVIGRQVTMLVPGERHDEEARIIEQIRSGSRVEPHETRRRCKDGTVIDVSLTASPIYDEHGSIIGASKIARDITARKEAERLQHVLMDEMKHRVKNSLATVQAIARQTFRSNRDLETSRDEFEARLKSLAWAHDLLTRERWDGADLGEVVAGVAGPYPREQFLIDGPPLQLRPRAVLAVSLALHELATNAVKYGALSVPFGRVAVTWETPETGAPRFILRWRESGGPPVAPPMRKGFGSRLVEDVLAAELNGTVTLSFEPSGVTCSVEAPIGIGWETDSD